MTEWISRCVPSQQSECHRYQRPAVILIGCAVALVNIWYVWCDPWSALSRSPRREKKQKTCWRKHIAQVLSHRLRQPFNCNATTFVPPSGECEHNPVVGNGYVLWVFPQSLHNCVQPHTCVCHPLRCRSTKGGYAHLTVERWYSPPLLKSFNFPVMYPIWTCWQNIWSYFHGQIFIAAQNWNTFCRFRGVWWIVCLTSLIQCLFGSKQKVNFKGKYLRISDVEMQRCRDVKSIHILCLGLGQSVDSWVKKNLW